MENKDTETKTQNKILNINISRTILGLSLIHI